MRTARLSLNYFDWLIEDLGSLNGTFVAGEPSAEPTFIFPRQDVQVGDVQLHLRRLRSDDAASGWRDVHDPPRQDVFPRSPARAPLL